MKYLSTRDKELRVSPSEAIIQGISKDGGLFVPVKLPKIENLEKLSKMDYKELAFFIMSKFFTDFNEELLKDAINKAYDEKFKGEDKVSIEKVEDKYILELFHGPTFAFKDMALSILPYLFKIALETKKIEKEIVILTATSGDTGKAALEGFADVEGIKIIIFFPENGVSNIQKLQMLTQEGNNTFVVGIDGNFDDAQTGVKNIFNNKELIELLDNYNYKLSSANSINIGRLVPQIVYYFYGYLNLLNQGELVSGEKINISVPTGNFGNILAAYYAKEMGLPVNKLICSSNENNILSDFLNTGIYDKRRELKITSSPSMDILISSNLERLLFSILDENDKYIKDKMERLNKEGIYKIDNNIIKDFYGDYSREDEITKTIKDSFQKNNYLMDPHTAVACNVYEKYKTKTGDNTKTIIASTASPFKFGEKVGESIGVDINNKDGFEILKDIENISNTKVPDEISQLKEKDIIHNNYCDREDMEKLLKTFLKVGEGNV